MAGICHESLKKMLQEMQSQKKVSHEFHPSHFPCISPYQIASTFGVLELATHCLGLTHMEQFVCSHETVTTALSVPLSLPLRSVFWPTVTVRTSKSSTNQTFTVTTARSSHSNKEARSSMDRCKFNSNMPAPHIYLRAISMFDLKDSSASKKYFFLMYLQFSQNVHILQISFFTPPSRQLWALLAVQLRCAAAFAALLQLALLLLLAPHRLP